MRRRHEWKRFASTLGIGFIKFSQHLGRIGIADAELETTQAELHRIPKRRTAYKGDCRSKKKTHFPETHRKLLISGQPGDDGLLARFE
jgi:hypothetical protein